MNELENINESFLDAGKQSPFSVPDGYFDKLPTRIQERCMGETESETSTPLIQVIKSQLALASGFIALAFFAILGYYYIQPNPQGRPLSQDDYIEIVQKNIYDYDEGRLVNASGGFVSYDTLVNEFNEEVIQYLLDQNVDYVTLIEQY